MGTRWHQGRRAVCAASAVLALGCTPLQQADVASGGPSTDSTGASTGAVAEPNVTGTSGADTASGGASGSSGMVTATSSMSTSSSPSDESSSTSDTSPIADGSSTSGTTGELLPVELIYIPAVTACVALDDPDPDECAAQTDAGYFQCDGDESALGGSEVRGYLHFDGLALGGVTVQTATLRMVAHPGDLGSASGAIWEVDSFTYAGLFGSVPAAIGDGPLAVSPGPVPGTLVVEWSLPPEALQGATELYLGLVTDSNDGVDYNDENTKQPPELIVTGLG